MESERDIGQFGRGAVLEGSVTGVGGRVHLWVSPAGGEYERLCDGVRWGDPLLLVPEPPMSGSMGWEYYSVLACVECALVFQMDQDRKRPRLKVPARSLIYLDEPPPELGEPSEAERQMLVLSLNDVASFYAGQYRPLQKGERGGHYYQPVFGLLRRYHWKTGDLSLLLEEIPSFLDRERAKDEANPNRRNRAARYAEMLDAYREFCVQKRVTETFAGFRDTIIRITNDVGVRVKTDVGLMVNGKRYVVIVRLSKNPPCRAYQQAVAYFLHLAYARHPTLWQGDNGLFDVRRQDILPMLACRREEEEAIWDSAERLGKMWSSAP